MKDLKQGDAVYVQRGDFMEAAQVDHTYTSCTGHLCVSFTSGANAHRVAVITYDEYWDRQREAAKSLYVEGEDDKQGSRDTIAHLERNHQ